MGPIQSDETDTPLLLGLVDTLGNECVRDFSQLFSVLCKVVVPNMDENEITR